MDSLTQLAFGAACGEAVLGRQAGKKAMLWGAVLATLPDLDVFIPLGGPVNDFVYHRAFSHSLFLLAVVSPIFAWIISRIHSDTRHLYRKWVLLCFLVLESAVLLDLMTIYGTQVLWPFDTMPKAIPVLFIIDPFFTFPVLGGTLAALFLRKRSDLGHRLNRIGLSMSLVYLAWALGAGLLVNAKIEEKLARQHIGYTQFIASPAPFNTLLWRVVGINKDQYFETYYSLLDGDAPLFVDVYPRNLNLIQGMQDHPPVNKLRRFTRGYYALSEVDGYVAVSDLRMGSEPDYVFRFKVAKRNNSQSIPIDDERLRTKRDLSQLSWVWDRIWKPIPKT